MVVTVVTPSYNQSQFLAENIECVLGQEGDSYLECIIVDSGSDDDSVEIIKRYERLLNEGVWKVRCRNIHCRWITRSKEDHRLLELIRTAYDESGNIYDSLSLHPDKTRVVYCKESRRTTMSPIRVSIFWGMPFAHGQRGINAASSL